MSQRTAIVATVVGGLVLIVLIIVLFGLPRPPDEFEICRQPLPDDRKAGISASTDATGKVTVSLSGEISQPGVPTQAQLDAYIACIRQLRPNAPIEVSNHVDIPAQPLGQTINQWARDASLPRVLVSSSDQPTLALVRIGPDRGTKSEVMARWCEENAACVRCDPESPDAGTRQVEVSLIGGASWTRVEMKSQTGDPWIKNDTPELWQDVDDLGRRWMLACG